jgi:hypothetical protein
MLPPIENVVEEPAAETSAPAEPEASLPANEAAPAEPTDAPTNSF